MIDTEGLDFHPKYVEPFYRGLIGFSFTKSELVPNPAGFLSSIRALREELSNAEIVTLLNGSWRPSKVGAWIIGLCQIRELEKDLIQYLQSRPIHCEHIIINLTLLNSASGKKALRNFVEDRLEKVLELTQKGREYEAGSTFENNSLAWAFSAIRYLDSTNATKYFEALLNSDKWKELKTEWLKISKSSLKEIQLSDMLKNVQREDTEFTKNIEMIREETKIGHSS